MRAKKQNPLFQVVFKAKSQTARVSSVSAIVAAKNNDDAVMTARQHCLISVSRWNVDSVEQVTA
jgi:hypothetical protein